MKIWLTREIVESFGSAIEEAAPGCELVVLEADGSYTGDPDEAEVALFTPLLAVNKEQSKGLGSMLHGAALRWLQGPGAGVDHPIWKMLLDRGVRLTNASGIHAEPIAQYIFAYVLHWERNVALHQERQRARHWEIIVSGDQTEKTIGIVGLGGIGLATARVAKALGMRVLATRRTPGGEPNVDRVLPPAQLHELLAERFHGTLGKLVETRTELGHIEEQLAYVLKMERDEQFEKLTELTESYESTRRKIEALENIRTAREQAREESNLMDLLSSKESVAAEDDFAFADDDHEDDDTEEYEVEIYEDEDGSFYYIDPDSGEEVPSDEDGNPL